MSELPHYMFDIHTSRKCYCVVQLDKSIIFFIINYYLFRRLMLLECI